MRITRLGIGLILTILGVYLQAQSAGQKITVTGKLVRMMAIGGESTGWVIEFDSETTVDGKKLNSIQMNYSDTAKLGTLENKRVTATGRLGYRHGVETGEQPVLKVSSIRPAKAAGQPKSGKET